MKVDHDILAGWSIMAAIAVAILAYGVAYINSESDCASHGGVLVDSPTWYECVEPKR